MIQVGNKTGRKGRRWWMIPLIICCVLVVILAVLIWWLPSFVMTGKRQTLDEAMKWQTDHYDTSFYEGLERKSYEVAGEGGYLLHAEYLRNPNPTTKYVILSHGYTDNRFGSLKYAPIYLRLGFNLIIYDLRGHGENESTFTTYGVLEGTDLYKMIQDARERYPDMTVLGLHGESLGAATTVTCLKYKPEVDFAVADCGFSDIENVLKGGIKNANGPAVLVDLADIGARLRYHYSIKAMRPIESLNDNEIPVLFLHGENDTFILPKNSSDMAERTKGYKEYHVIPKAAHAVSVLTDPVLYEEHVRQFLKNIGMQVETCD